MHQSLPFQDIKRFSFLKSDERASAFQQHLMGYLIKKSIKRADGVIVQTPWVKDAVVKKTGVSPNKIWFVEPIKKSISFLSPYTLGIYCMHYLIGDLMTLTVKEPSFLMCIFIFVICYVISIIINYIPIKSIKMLIK